MDVLSLQQQVRKRSLILRAMDRLVHSLRFQEAWKLDASEKVNDWVKEGNIDALEDWVENTLKANMDVAELSIRDLRAKASKLGLLYATSFTKEELIIWITQHASRTEKAAG